MIDRPLPLLAARYATYLGATIPTEIAPCDDMFRSGREEGYLINGRTAIEVILSAMLAAGRTEFATVLDLPCGGGRVTRHLRALFPESEVYVSDIVGEKQGWVVDRLGGLPFDPPSFHEAPARTFDLIWVGSLLTHLNRELFMAALSWFIAALAPDGLLIVTLHGRAWPQLHTEESRALRDRDGFAFRVVDGPTYGDALVAPSWVLRHVETRPDIRVIGYHEGAWNEHQDALAVQKRAIR